MTPDAMWEMIMEGSQELAEELGVDPAGPPARLLEAVDTWLAERPAGERLDDEDAARLGLLLARLLIERHGGGLGRIEEEGHPLDGEWTVTGFGRGLAEDYQVPFLVSAWRIGVERDLGARDWYEQVRREGARAAGRG